MKNIAMVFAVFFIAINARTQQDTIEISRFDLADSVYANLDPLNIPDGRLFNRVFMDYESSVVSHFQERTVDTANADFFYGALGELFLMSEDTAQFLKREDVYNSALKFYAKQDYEQEKVVIPLGIIDYNYQMFNEDSAIAKNYMYRQNLQLFENDNAESVYETQNVRMIAPMYDFVYDNVMYFVFKEEWFYTDQDKTITELKIDVGNGYESVDFGQEIAFYPSDNAMQYLEVKVTFSDGSYVSNILSTRTPEASLAKASGGDPCYGGTVEFEHPDNTDFKLKTCIMPGCFEWDDPIIDKPFILVTGYRPPLFGQAFEKSYEIYSTYHDAYLQSLIENAYDVFVVKYNVHEEHETYGLLEMSELLKEFLTWINTTKSASHGQEYYDTYYENVIQGSSMGASVSAMALMMMEKDHQDNGGIHHHTRLFISYDANWFGANIPLSYSSMIYSQHEHFDPLTLTVVASGVPFAAPFLQEYLYNTVEQKSFKELVKYHPMNQNRNINFPQDPHVHFSHEPTSNVYREIWELKMALQDNHEHFIPLPKDTRNIAVSLGSFDGTPNSAKEPNLHFEPAGDNFRGSNADTKYYTASAKMTTIANPYKIFHRQSFFGYDGIPFVFTNQSSKVYNMLEIDDANGSYLNSIGNLVEIADYAYIGGLSAFSHIKNSSHKSVVTALAINKDYWPGDGSMNVDLQDLGLMYIDRDLTSPQDVNDFYGYPNVGIPQNHWNVTPFEAIYADADLDPHISLDQRPHVGELTGFLRNEIEPAYLEMQNQRFGDQVIYGYTYFGKYRAQNVITVGREVTPKTDVGDFVVTSRGDLTLRAGEEIILEPGFETEFGARFDAYGSPQAYWQCDNSKSAGGDTGGSSSSNSGVELFKRESVDTPEHRESEERNNGLLLYPNPGEDFIQLQLTEGGAVEAVSIYDMTGKKVYSEADAPKNNIKIFHGLEKGTYIIKVLSNKHQYTQNFVVL